MKTLLSLIIFLSQFVLSQAQVGPRICGNIIDAETREPIAYANIFISNSSIGGASDKNGYFELRNVPYGRYEIIASVIGYEVLKAKVGVYNDSRRNFRFEMYKQPIQFPEIIVSAKETRKRRRQLQSFRRNLLGTSQNGKKSYIKNEDVIRFSENKRGVLLAFAEEPLEIINNGLGYKLYYVLEDFELTHDYVKYTGYPHFTEITAKTFHDSVDWPENRKNTYTGSLRHFLTTICENYEITNGDTSERVYVKDMGGMIERGVRLTYGDTTHIEDEGFFVMKTKYLRGVSQSTKRQLVNTNWFLSESANANEMYLQFDGFLEVKYNNEYFPFEKSYYSTRKVSWINMTCDSTILDKQGRYFDIYAIKTTGLWSKERVADMLPFDYSYQKE
ncbi:carboxypeptidase-like regulatory domain-containing protein [Candidatus Neomarinimicrobiota bacterium]